MFYSSARAERLKEGFRSGSTCTRTRTCLLLRFASIEVSVVTKSIFNVRLRGVRNSYGIVGVHQLLASNKSSKPLAVELASILETKPGR